MELIKRMYMTLLSKLYNIFDHATYKTIEFRQRIRDGARF
jgi:hypothetical protein